jgi:3D (Asp-Asp-Asp) domain-containing protein
MYRLTFIVLLILVSARFTDFSFSKGEVLGLFAVSKEDYLEHRVDVITTTVFDQREDVEYVQVPYSTRYEKNSDLEYGLQEVTQEGVPGVKTLTYLITFWQDEEIDRVLTSTETEPPVDEVISEGTKIMWRVLEGTEHGRLNYWHKMRVWATKYDANCIGCTGRTFSGTEVVKGVCAVDPRVIPLGTNFYVVGYGLCRAEDIGGAIKGNIIDLGYEVAALGAWRTGWTDIYLLTNAPE